MAITNTRNRRWLQLTIVWAVWMAIIGGAIHRPRILQGANLCSGSGIVVHDNHLLMVGDDQHGVYFRYPIDEFEGPLAALGCKDTEKVPLRRLEQVEKTAETLGDWCPTINDEDPCSQQTGEGSPQTTDWATDLESITFLGHHGVAVLSEDDRAIYGEKGLIVQYPRNLAEISNRGLEGLASRPLSDGGSMVAVLHEGINREGGDPRPTVWIHSISAEDRKLTIGDSDMKPIPLEVSSLADDETFRAPDLVWYQLSPGVWGFIVLLSSAEQPYKHVRLVRFTEDGKRVTSDTPDVDIRGLMKEARRRENNCPHDGRLNWEGLGWFNELHTRLILIHDVEKKAIPCALVVDIPEHWIRN